MAPMDQQLTEEERQRNGYGKALLFTYNGDKIAKNKTGHPSAAGSNEQKKPAPNSKPLPKGFPNLDKDLSEYFRIFGRLKIRNMEIYNQLSTIWSNCFPYRKWPDCQRSLVQRADGGVFCRISDFQAYSAQCKLFFGYLISIFCLNFGIGVHRYMVINVTKLSARAETGRRARLPGQQQKRQHGAVCGAAAGDGLEKGVARHAGWPSARPRSQCQLALPDSGRGVQPGHPGDGVINHYNFMFYGSCKML